MSDWNFTLPEFNENKHHEMWTDRCGFEYRAGDVVVVWRQSSLSLGYVMRINKINTNNAPIGHHAFSGERDENDRPIRIWVPSCTVSWGSLDFSERWGRSAGGNATPEKIIKHHLTIPELIHLPEEAQEAYRLRSQP